MPDRTLDYASPRTRRKLIIDWLLAVLVILLLVDIAVIAYAHISLRD